MRRTFAGARRGPGTRRCTRRDRGQAGPLRGRLAAHELGRRGARFVAAAKQLQDILGDHQDAVVAQARIRDWAAG